VVELKKMNAQIQTFHSSSSFPDKPAGPDEDFLLVRNNIFAVFDGVTLLFQDPYPDPSPAYDVSQIAAETIAEGISQDVSQRTVSLLSKVFKEANSCVKEYNNRLGITRKTVDHLSRQYASTVGAFGFFANGILYFAQINDSGVMVFDPLGNREVDFVINSKPLINYLTDLEKAGKFQPGSKEEHIFIRSQVVNNCNLFYQNQKIDFGVMNGQDEAVDFLHFGCCNIVSGQIALFYTDGFLPFVYDKEFIKVLLVAGDKSKITEYISQKETLGEKFQKEKTMIVVHFS